MFSRLLGTFGALRSNPGLRSAFRRRALLIKGTANRMFGRVADSADVRAYEIMREDHGTSGDLYTAGKFWSKFNRAHSAAIWAGGLLNLRNEYFNRTFSGPEPESRQVYRALLFMYYKHVKQFDVDNFLDAYEDPRVGGTNDQEIFFGRAVSLDFLQSIEEAYKIRNAWHLAGRSGAPRVIVELGAGYGRLAYVCKKMLPGCCYVILDLPEALICAQSWLSRVLGNEVVAYEEHRSTTRLTRDELTAGSKVLLLLPHQIEAIGADSVDVFVNIYSFAEMPAAAIANYFKHLDRITNGIFFTKQRTTESNVLDNVEVSETSYPTPRHWRQLSRSVSTLYDNFFEAVYATRDG